jgi:hypothetical protein
MAQRLIEPAIELAPEALREGRSRRINELFDPLESELAKAFHIPGLQAQRCDWQ